ncbi:hypothetical protein COI93_10265 [Bacillus cereus]|uniref:Uncharacterized protein n=1 Tax=Bacillus cereus TaxID=1396 RepID=A0A2B0MF29_BACCE|nr:hypothetical protein COI93_10265 [Bacillus cereus]
MNGKISVQVKDPNSDNYISVPAEQLNANELKTTKNILEDFDRTLKIADKMKAEKAGDKYKLTLELKGKEGTEVLKNIDANAQKVFEEQLIQYM